MASQKFSIPPGFVWSHAADTYVHPDGRTWDDKTNEVRGPGHKDGGLSDLPPHTMAPLTTEQLIVKEGATAPRVTPADVEAAIKEEKYTRLSGTLMICELTLQNGFIVTGESACASPENFRESIGRDVSRKAAAAKIWPLLGYELRTRLSDNDIKKVGEQS